MKEIRQKSKGIQNYVDLNAIQLDGIDIVDALKRLGCDHKVFSEILHNFCVFYIDVGERLKQMLDSGKIEELKREAHSLKGSASNVSAVSLYLAAKNFESTLENKTQEFYSAAIAEVEAKFEELLKSDELLKESIDSVRC